MAAVSSSVPTGCSTSVSVTAAPDALLLPADFDEYRRYSRLFKAAVAEIAAGTAAPFEYEQDEHTGDYWPRTDAPGWQEHERAAGASCARG